mgnify:CR=1 FL=1
MTKDWLEEGDECGVTGCTGHYQFVTDHKDASCSCHINPPCAKCTDQHLECDTCGDEIHEDRMNDFVMQVTPRQDAYVAWKPRELDRTKIDWHSLSHTHFTMIKRGVFPIGTAKAVVLEKVKGTFGGRFNYFREDTGDFEYVAYTD